MLLPLVPEIPQDRRYLQEFKGYNRHERVGEGEFVDIGNMSNDEYPVLTTRAKRYELDKKFTYVAGMVSLDGHLYVLGTDSYLAEDDPERARIFLYKDGELVRESNYYRNRMQGTYQRRLLRNGDKIFIYPDKLVYDIAKNSITPMETYGFTTGNVYSYVTETESEIPGNQTGDVVGFKVTSETLDKFQLYDVVEVRIAKNTVYSDLENTSKYLGSFAISGKAYNKTFLNIEGSNVLYIRDNGQLRDSLNAPGWVVVAFVRRVQDMDLLTTYNNKIYGVKWGDEVKETDVSVTNDTESIVRVNASGDADANGDFVAFGVDESDLDLFEVEGTVIVRTRDNVGILSVHGEFPVSSIDRTLNRIIIRDQEKQLGTAPYGTTVEDRYPSYVHLIRRVKTGILNNAIYISSGADVLDFYENAGGTEITVGEVGEFTGIAPFNGSVYAFKRDCAIRISGTYPNVSTQILHVPGVAKGAEKSIAYHDGYLYYKGEMGVYRFNGEYATLVSDAFGARRYTGGVGAFFGDKYYLSVTGNPSDEEIEKVTGRKVNAGGIFGGLINLLIGLAGKIKSVFMSLKFPLFVFDVARGTWQIETLGGITSLNTNLITDMTYSEGVLYVARTDGTIDAIADSKPLYESSTIESDFDWWCQTGVLGYDTPDEKHVGRMLVRLRIQPTTSVSVKIRFDDDTEWENVATIKDSGIKSVVVPIIPRRCDVYQIRIEGKGECKIYGVTTTLEGGSDVQWHL